jgi:hypothetical protein
MKSGDICTLFNLTEMRKANLPDDRVGSRVVLRSSYAWHHSPTHSQDGWHFHYEDDQHTLQWWAPVDCLQSTQQERKQTNEMRPGDKAKLTRYNRLKDVNLEGREGTKVTLVRPMTLAEIANKPKMAGEAGWWVEIDPASVRWYVPASCLEPCEEVTKKSHYKAGDKCRLVDREALAAVSMGSHYDEICTLVRQMSQSEIDSKSSLALYRTENAWLATLPGLSYQYYVPERCLLLHQSIQGTAYGGSSAQQITEQDITLLNKLGRDQTTQTERQIDMYLHTITIIRVPSTLAQQAGEIDEIIAGPTAVLSKDANSGIAKVAAMNAEAVLKASEKSALRIVCSSAQ